MKLSDFYTFCDNVIKKYCDEILKEDEGTHCLKFSEKKLNNIYVYYEQKRVEVKKYYMQDANKILDRHKIASCMLYAILKSRVFKINRLIPNIPTRLLLANEYLAFYVAINIVEMFKRTEKEYPFYENYLLIFPKTYHIHPDFKENTFLFNTCSGLSSIKNLKYFDIIAYSTILFQIEKYTDTILEYENAKNIGTNTSC